jgi:3D (Asp-Asp-Asp) domain-containing protein
VAAVDPRFIRLKTPLYIEGYGYAIAADKGGAIKGSKIDLCFNTYEEAVRFGRKTVKVYLLR